MPNQASLEQIELAELTQSVDDGRATADPFKLPAGMRTLVDTRLTDLKAKDSATLTSGGDRATASANLRAALDQLQRLLRDGYNFIQGLGSFAISDAERIGTSSTTTVSLVDLGPLTSGVTYEFWLVGHNSRGDGLESNRVTHVAT